MKESLRIQRTIVNSEAVVENKLNKDHFEWMQDERRSRRHGNFVKADKLIEKVLNDVNQFDLEDPDRFDEEEWMIGNLVKKGKK